MTKIAVVRYSEIDRLQGRMCRNCRCMVDALHVTAGEVEDGPPEIAALRAEQDRQSQMAKAELVRESLDELLSKTTEEFGTTVPMIMEHVQTRERVKVRREFSRRAKRMGYSYPEIGKILRLHHSTIVHLVRHDR